MFEYLFVIAYAIKHIKWDMVHVEIILLSRIKRIKLIDCFKRKKARHNIYNNFGSCA